MKKFTALDVLAFDPTLTPADVAEILEELNREPVPMSERWDAENDDLVRSILNPPQLGPDGLTNVMRDINARAKEMGLEIPFPPPDWAKRQGDRSPLTAMQIGTAF